MDNLPLTRKHITAMLVTCFGPYFEAYDQVNISSVLLVLLVPFDLSLGLAGLVTSSTTYGLLFGTLIAGPLADKYGRRKVFTAFVVWFSLLSFSSAFSYNFISLFTVRLIEGVGLGGMLPIGLVVISEILPHSQRKYVPIYQSTYGLGNFSATLASLLLITGPPILGFAGWRWVFLLGAIPGLYSVVLVWKLTESPRWLVRKGRVAEARAIVGQFEASAAKKGFKVQAVPQGTPLKSGEHIGVTRHWKDLFSGTYGKRTVINSSYWFLYSFVAGLPTLTLILLTKEGFSVATTLTFSLIAGVFQPIGILASAYIMEWIGRRNAIVLYNCMVAIEIFFVLRTNSPYVITTCLAMSYFFSPPATALTWAYIGEQYPTDIRATASGFMNVWQRLGTATAASVGGFWATYWFGIYGNYLMVYTITPALIVAVAIGLRFFGYETKGKANEDLLNVERSQVTGSTGQGTASKGT